MLLLYLAIKNDVWPLGRPEWMLPFYTIVIVTPIFVLLSLRPDNIKKTFVWAGVLTAMAGLTGYYVGDQAISLSMYSIDNDYVHAPSLNDVYVHYGLMMGIVGLMFLMFMQQNSAKKNFPYSALYKFLWKNFLVLVLSAFFAVALLVVLLLCAIVLEIIKIDSFMGLFSKKYFTYPVLAMWFTFGVIIFRDKEKIIGVLARIQQFLTKYFLLVLILLSIIFIVALAFTGLAPLWDSKLGSGMLLWMQALIIFMLNATYQYDVKVRPFSLWLHRFVYVGIALLPI